VTAVRLNLQVRVAAFAGEVRLDAGHLDRLVRCAAYRAIADGLVGPQASLAARVIAGRVRERHGDVRCLESIVVELLDGASAPVARVEFERAVFGAFALARGLHLLDESGGAADATVVYALHASAADDDPLPVALPAFEPVSLAALAADAEPVGAPGDGWIATFIAPAVVDGFAALADESRASGDETVGLVHARLGFDAERRTFVRIFERLLRSPATQASPLRVISTGASWGPYLALAGDRPSAPTSVHTHLHLTTPDAAPCISIDDLIAHYTQFQDPGSAAAIVTIYPDRHEPTLYGYGRDGLLARAPGHYLLCRPAAGGAAPEEDSSHAA